MKGRAEASSVLLSSAFLLGFIVSERVTDHLADPICLFFLFAGGVRQPWQGFFAQELTAGEALQCER